MKIYNLQINHMNTAVGISGENIRIMWKVADCKKQTAYEVVINDASGQVYSSGKAESSKTYHQLESKLKPRTCYKVSLTAYDEANKASEVETIELITGIEKTAWKAKWINPELTSNPKERKRGAYLIKDFELTSEQVARAKEQRAFLYATAHGLMNIYINDAEITDYQLMPGSQQYDKRLMVETLEVGSFLKEGTNRMVVTLGDGWYRGAMGNNQEHNLYGTDIAFLGQLEIGGQTALASDESWKATSEGPLGLNDFMKGEEYDATRSLDRLHEVKVEKFGLENLIDVDTVPIMPHETFSAKWLTTPNGEKILDFGQNIAGYVKLQFNAPVAGKTITMVHGETLDENGNFTIKNFQNAVVTCDQKVTYICKDGLNEYHPTKTYMGFRYVQVIADFELEAEWFTAVSIYSDMGVLSDFECGVPEVNQLFKNALWSMKGNFIDVPTDCPTREKSGYSGDCQAYVYTAMYLMDCYSVYAKWMREVAAGQYKDGLLPQISPKDCKPNEKQKMMKVMTLDGGIGWSDAFEIVPYRMYKRYGDDNMIRENYAPMKRWTDYEIKRASKTRRSNKNLLPKEHRKYMIDQGWFWGEWLEPCQDDKNYMSNLIMHGDPEVGTAFFYQHLKFVEKMAELMEDEAEAKECRDLAEKALAAYRAVFTDNGRITEPSRQCRYVRPIAHNILTEEEKYKAAEELADIITKNNNHLGTGFLTTHELCRVLSDYGQTSKAYDLLLQKEMPGFLYAVTLGCTTIPESWDCYGADGKSAPYNSFNHYSYGAIAGWLMDSVCGIRIDEEEITIAPKPDERLGYAKASYESPYGKITSGWRYEDGQCHYEIEIPANARALIKIEGREPVVVECGTYTF